MVSIKKGDFVLVMGGGQFGLCSVKLAMRKGAVTIVVDPNPACSCSSLSNMLCYNVDDLDMEAIGKVQILVSDGPTGLEKILVKKIPDIIVPSMPGHMLAWAYANRLHSHGVKCIPNKQGFKKIFDVFAPELISIANNNAAVLVLSRIPGDMSCQSTCIQPATCPVTGNKRTSPMYKMLEEKFSSLSVEGIVLRSHMLSSEEGVGGIDGQELNEILDNSLEITGDVALATACGCHAVVNFFKVG